MKCKAILRSFLGEAYCSTTERVEEDLVCAIQRAWEDHEGKDKMLVGLCEIIQAYLLEDDTESGKALVKASLKYAEEHEQSLDAYLKRMYG